MVKIFGRISVTMVIICSVNVWNLVFWNLVREISKETDLGVYYTHQSTWKKGGQGKENLGKMNYPELLGNVGNSQG